MKTLFSSTQGRYCGCDKHLVRCHVRCLSNRGSVKVVKKSLDGSMPNGTHPDKLRGPTDIGAYKSLTATARAKLIQCIQKRPSIAFLIVVKQKLSLKSHIGFLPSAISQSAMISIFFRQVKYATSELPAASLYDFVSVLSATAVQTSNHEIVWKAAGPIILFQSETQLHTTVTAPFERVDVLIH